MKILVLMAGARAGAEFFQSLLDGHKQILQLPGILHVNGELIKILSIKSKKKLAEEFVKKYTYYFDSRKSNIERHNMLGSKKKSFYKVNKNFFIKRFIQISKKKKRFKNELFQNLYLIHLAYNSKLKERNIKTFVINAHIIPYVINFNFYFKNIKFEIIHTIRNPLASISSTLKNWTRYKNGFFFTPKELYYNLKLIFFGIDEMLKLNKKIYIIQLENLHQKSDKVLKKFCKIYKITFSNRLNNSTFHNLKWWGDKISSNDKSGINKKHKVNFDVKYFTKYDLAFFQNKYKFKLKNYCYEVISGQSHNLHLSPLKCEYLTWKNTFKNRRFKHIISIPYFYFKRLILFTFFYNKNTNLPVSIGLNKSKIIK